MSNDSLIVQFLQGQSCLIVEPSQAFSSSIQACLSRMGVPADSIVVARRMEDARVMIRERKPKLLITEYQIGAAFGLELVEAQEKLYDESARISMVVTKDMSDSVIAEAAEEQVDAFIIKPFSPDVFAKKLLAVLERKLNPSLYSQQIKRGKDHLLAKRYNEAIKEFVGAKALFPQPTLACFYAGEAYRQMGNPAQALVEYREGRKFQSLHYKCLVAEFDVLVSQTRYKEAYELIEPIKKNYPLSPKRLSQIFVTAVFALHFDEVGEYHELLLKLEQRPPELVKVASMALFTSGRHYLEKREIAKALPFFDKSLMVANRALAFLDRVVSELIRVGAKTEAQDFFAKALPSDIGSSEYNRLSLKVDQLVLSKDQLIEKARKLVMAGEGNEEIFTMVVRWMAEEGKVTLAETVIQRAIDQNPDLRAPLYKILEEQTRKN